MNWYQNDAPIRLKLKIAFSSLVGVMALVAVIALFAPLVIAGPVVAVLVAGAAIQCVRFRKAIADPYVTTVVRMEALAAGDLESPIQFTEYKDCVGRMTRAMFTFRDNAAEQRRLSTEQNSAVDIFSRHLQRVAEGDLTATINDALPSDYAALQENFNEALASLRGLLGTVIETTEAIRTGSVEIAQASEDLARRTEANAASLEETSAAIAQMNDRLKATATAASQTVVRADGAIATVSGGRDIADEAVQAMGRVSESAKGIDSVIEGLDKIAFQTRVLAMNAAVEAGRAGEAGRGFAVVADLVSALAMRAEEEAGRARDQLTATQTDVVAAVEMVQKVDGALADIASGVSEVHQLLGGMASDNQAQASAISEINSAITAMDQSTQQNAAMVEETSAAARNLTHEVEALSSQTVKFTIGNSPVTTNARAQRYTSPVRPKAAASAVIAAKAAERGSVNAVTHEEWATF